MRYAIVYLIAVLAALLMLGKTRADHYETRCVGGVCQQVLVLSTIPPAGAQRLPQTAEPPLAAIPPAEVRFPRARATVLRILPLRLGLKRLLLFRLFR